MQAEKQQDESSMELLRTQAFKDPLVIVATGFGIGWFPFAQGTVASLVIALLFWFFVPDSPVVQYTTVFMLFIGARLTLGALVRKYGDDDAPCIVVDEFLGMAIALFLIPKEWWLYLIAFLVFRIFDIVKPWPISWLETNVKGAYGVLLDDVIAGAVALGITHLIWFTMY